MESRLTRFRELMEEQQLESMLVSHPINRRYLTGFTGSSGWVVITQNEQFLISDFRYTGQAKEQAVHFQFVEHQGNPFADIKEILNRASVDSIAFEENHLTVAQHQKLQEALEPITTTPSSGLVEKVREVKEEEELKLLRDAVNIADQAFGEIVKKIAPGMTERQISLQLEFLMREQGAFSSSFDIIVASGPRSSLPHGVASDRVMEKGDLVTMDFGAYYKGYCSDITRTVMLGKPTDQQREIYEIVLEANRQAIEVIQGGVTGKEVDSVAREVIRKHGYGDAFGHSTGHGLGMEVHERPGLSPKEESRLQPGMVVTVEPGIYLPEIGGVRIEDDVVVTENGCEVLSKSSKELLIID
ncbi:aminopeptidase P family protein [Melghirimyces algeriensis]|uniref:Xaa-Pro aminopeptidase n=1 Tax=Melghirimyces algeriensis TaxID=910412 RepID=A0A521AYD0_9BACL|nr:aminopeptidase P family protein [Melghirimyces algeriensis]SMO39520.1 Xaa-Pro aminopeptidase [Melghirimyces algeriensis]